MPHATPAKPLRIAILMTDTPVEAVLTTDGDYGEVFVNLFRKAAAKADLPESALSFSKYDVVTKMEYPPSLDDIDAILMTGSKANAYDNEPWILKLVEYTQQVLAQERVRIVGVCYGHQILGRALGSPVIRHDTWEVAVCDVELTSEGKEVFGLERMKIQQMHRDIVTEWPKGAVPLGSSPTCKVQAMYSPKRYIAVQGHPEFTGHIVSEIVKARTPLLFSGPVAEDYQRRAQLDHDGVSIAATFLKFLQE